MADVKPIPDGYHNVTPYLVVDRGADAIEFYKQALGATERVRLAQPDGKIGHAELEIGDSVIMLCDEYPEMNALSPKSVGGSPVALHLYVEDVDAVVQSAVAAGAKVTQPIEDKFYGDRLGQIIDPFGQRVEHRHPHRGRRAGGDRTARSGLDADVVSGGQRDKGVCVAAATPEVSLRRGDFGAGRRQGRGTPPASE
jgi:PhnB protein